MNTKSRLALLAAALMSTATLAAPSRVALWETAHTRTETVQYKLSQASTPEGASALYARLKEAAVRVCSIESFGAVDDAASVDACITDALDSAVRSVRVPMVSVLHLQAARPATVAAR